MRLQKFFAGKRCGLPQSGGRGRRNSRCACSQPGTVPKDSPHSIAHSIGVWTSRDVPFPRPGRRQFTLETASDAEHTSGGDAAEKTGPLGPAPQRGRGPVHGRERPLREAGLCSPWAECPSETRSDSQPRASVAEGFGARPRPSVWPTGCGPPRRQTPGAAGRRALVGGRPSPQHPDVV